MQKEDIRSAVREVFSEERQNFWVPAEEHYNDHQYVKDLQSSAKTLKTAGLKAAVSLLGAGIIAVFAYIWHSIKAGG